MSFQYKGMLQASEGFIGALVSGCLFAYLWSSRYAPDNYCMVTFAVLNLLVLLFLLTALFQIYTAAAVIHGFWEESKKLLRAEMLFKTFVIGVFFVVLLSPVFDSSNPEEIIFFLAWLTLNSVYIAFAHHIYKQTQCKDAIVRGAK